MKLRSGLPLPNRVKDRCGKTDLDEHEGDSRAHGGDNAVGRQDKSDTRIHLYA